MAKSSEVAVGYVIDNDKRFTGPSRRLSTVYTLFLSLFLEPDKKTRKGFTFPLIASFPAPRFVCLARHLLSALYLSSFTMVCSTSSSLRLCLYPRIPEGCSRIVQMVE